MKFVVYYLPLNIFFIFRIFLGSCGFKHVRIYSIYWNEILLKIIFKLDKVDIFTKKNVQTFSIKKA